MLEQLTPPTITLNDQPLDMATSGMGGILSFITQVGILSSTIRLRKLAEAQIPRGSISSKYDITNQVLVLRPEIPWISFSITNDGEDPVLTGVAVGGGANLAVNRAPLNKDEILDVNFGYPIIDMLMVKAVDKTGTATVRIIAKLGSIEGYNYIKGIFPKIGVA